MVQFANSKKNAPPGLEQLRSQLIKEPQMNTAESWKPLVCGLQVKILYRNRLQKTCSFTVFYICGVANSKIYISLMLHQLLIPLKWLPPIPRCSWPSAYCPKDLSIEGHSGGFLWCWPRTWKPAWRWKPALLATSSQIRPATWISKDRKKVFSSLGSWRKQCVHFSSRVTQLVKPHPTS